MVTTPTHPHGQPHRQDRAQPDDGDALAPGAAPVAAARRSAVGRERGITTAEYAVGTAAGAGLAGLLYSLLTGGFGDRMLKTLFDHVLGLLGIG